MAPRPTWKGYLKLSLVSCPIALYTGVDAGERISFRQVNRATGNRLRHHLVDSVTGDVVETHDKGRGYEVGEKQFVLVEDEELDEARAEARTKPFGVAPTAKQMRRQAAATRVVRGSQLASSHRQEVVEPESLGHEARQKGWHRKGARRRGAQIGDHHAQNVGEWRSV
jgi:Ku70/Ku80 beta-barrel domain